MHPTQITFLAVGVFYYVAPSLAAAIGQRDSGSLNFSLKARINPEGSLWADQGNCVSSCSGSCSFISASSSWQCNPVVDPQASGGSSDTSGVYTDTSTDTALKG